MFWGAIPSQHMLIINSAGENQGSPGNEKMIGKVYQRQKCLYYKIQNRRSNVRYLKIKNSHVKNKQNL